MSILLIRHGETASNAGRVVQTPDIPLNERGIEQARRLAARVRELGIERLISSDHTRAAMTSAEIELATGVRTQWDEGLRERDFGDIRGRPYADIGVDIFARDYAPPGGETWTQFNARVDAAWDRIAALAASCEGNLAVVTHGFFCRSLVERRLELSSDLPPVSAFHNTALTVIGATPPWIVERINCCAHLEGADQPLQRGMRV